jgi:hypothetical protein
MKYFKIVIIIIIIAYFFPKSFETYPGYTTKEVYDSWESNEKKTCYGFVYVTKGDAGGDWVDKDICIGMPI